MKLLSLRINLIILIVTGICLLFCPTIVLQAQQKSVFQGVIRDATDSSALVAAVVKIKEDFSTGTISDQEGRFSMKLDPGTYTFIISFIGMESETITLSLKPGETIETAKLSIYGEICRLPEPGYRRMAQGLCRT